MKRILAVGSILLGFLGSASGQASFAAPIPQGPPFFLLDDRTLSEEQFNQIETFLNQVYEKLPVTITQTITQSIFLKFVPSISHWHQRQSLQDPCKPGRVKLARSYAWTNEVKILADFKNEIFKGPDHSTSFNCEHKNYYRFAQATLIHEIIHLYDYQMKKREGHRLSEDKQFLNLTGWYQEGWIFKHRKQENQLKVRSPDPLEFKNPKETLAVNMEFFLLDPEFKCRRPSLYTFFTTQFHHVPFPQYSCSLNTSVQVQSAGLDSTRIINMSIDPERIYQVHYLLASKGEDWSSRWGHAMLRFVMCKPGRPLGPRCLTHDTAYHIVASYRANVQDIMTNALKGLTGHYPSQVFLYSLNDIINEYTRDELRDLISVPIKLTPDEIKLSGYRLLEQYWDYQGKYYFLSNNCAVEAFNSIKSALPDNANDDLQDSSSITPQGVLKKLITHGAIDPTGLASEDGRTFQILDREQNILDPKLAEKRGYLFSKKTAQLEDNFSYLKTFAPLRPFGELNEYISKTSAEERLSLFHTITESPSISQPEKLKVALSFDILETQIQRMLRKSFFKLIGKTLLENKKDIPSFVEDLWRLASRISPWNWAPGSYGVPLPNDFTHDHQESLQADLRRFQESQKEVVEWAQHRFSSYYDEQKKCEMNRKTFQKLAIEE